MSHYRGQPWWSESHSKIITRAFGLVELRGLEPLPPACKVPSRPAVQRLTWLLMQRGVSTRHRDVPEVMAR
jgi:hypothetical protein